jgi:hypothetical protein
MARERGRILENDTELLSLYSISKLTSLCGSAKVADERRRERAKQLIK